MPALPAYSCSCFFCVFLSDFIAVQHERKPIVDKKEFGSSPTTSSHTAQKLQCLAGAGSAAAASLKTETSPHYQPRTKSAPSAAAASLFSHNVNAAAAMQQAMQQCNNANSAAMHAGNAAAASIFSLDNPLASSIYPLGLNFAELTQTLSKFCCIIIRVQFIVTF